MAIEELPTREGYNLWAPHYESNGNPMTGLDQIVFEQQLPLKLVDGKTVLDIGCGTGRLTRLISRKGAKVTGIDISGKMLEIAREKDIKSEYIHFMPNATFPFNENTYDFIVSNPVLEHVENLAVLFQGNCPYKQKKKLYIYFGYASGNVVKSNTS